jgi:flagellar basal-body rod protein FlgB
MDPYGGIDTSRLLLSGMRVAQANHRFIANNIANVDTPGYNPVSLDFQATLRDAIEGRGRIALRRTRPRHLKAEVFRPAMAGLVIQSKTDYNKVDIDQEIANLSKNTGRFTVYGSLLVKQFQMVTNMLSNTR